MNPFKRKVNQKSLQNRAKCRSILEGNTFFFSTGSNQNFLNDYASACVRLLCSNDSLPHILSPQLKVVLSTYKG